MRNEKGEITVKSIWKWLRSDKGKRYSFFLFYIFFFIIIFIFLSYRDDTQVNENKEENLSLPFSTTLFDKSEYDFVYTINYNENSVDYLGKKNGTSIILRDDRGAYNYIYQDGNLIYQGIENPLVYQEFLDSYELKRIIKNAELVSETKLKQTNEYIYTYTIKTEELFELFNKDFIIQDNLDNEIIVKTDSNNQISEITLDILNYVISINETIEEEILTYEIVINYGEV